MAVARLLPVFEVTHLRVHVVVLLRQILTDKALVKLRFLVAGCEFVVDLFSLEKVELLLYGNCFQDVLDRVRQSERRPAHNND